MNSFEVHGLVVDVGAHSHPLYGSKGKPLYGSSNFLTPSSVHESPVPASPVRNATEPVAVSVSSSPPPCGRKRGRERWGGRTRGTHRGCCRSRSRSTRHCQIRPAEENEVGSGGEGRRGANGEEVAVAFRDQHVVALAPHVRAPI